MEARKLSVYYILFFAILATAVEGCSHKPVRPSQTTESNGSSSAPAVPASTAETMGPPEAFGPPVPKEAALPSYGPEPMQVRSIVLVFGPGMARSYADAGVLRALEEAQIPVAAVLGTEMGALMAALYSMSDSINEFEWSLMGFKEDIFTPEGGLISKLSRKMGASRKLESALKKVFNGRDLHEAKIPTRLAVQEAGGKTYHVLDQGKVERLVRTALASPGFFEPTAWDSSGVLGEAALQSRPYLVNEAKSLGLGPVVVIDVLGDSETANVPDLGAADLVIKPDMAGLTTADFQKKTEAIFRGKSAIQAQVQKLREIAGLPPLVEGQNP